MTWLLPLLLLSAPSTGGCVLRTTAEIRPGNTLRIRVENVGSDVCRLWLSSNPEMNENAVALRANRVSDMKPLNRSVPIADFPAREASLKPGAAWTRLLGLEVEFPDLQAALREGSVLIAWGYTPWTPSGECLPTEFGALLLRATQGSDEMRRPASRRSP